MTVKFMYNGINIDGKLYKASYSVGGHYAPESGLSEDTITMYVDGYKRIPRVVGLTIRNDTDSMVDYFDKDAIIIAPNDKYYGDAKKGYISYLQKRIKVVEKRIESGKWRYNKDTLLELKRSLEKVLAA